MMTTGASATGIANIAMDGTVLDTWYPNPQLDDTVTESGTRRLGAQDLTPQLLRQVLLDEDRRVEQVAVRTTIEDLSKPPVDSHDAYLRLHLLSHRIVTPHSIQMADVFDELNIVAWTNKGPCQPDNFEALRTNLRMRGLIHVYSIDRMPRMVDYVVPSGVRIAEAERVRLGAYLAPGTRVLREGYVSFNSGSLGAARIEGRLSSSAVIGEDTDVGLSSAIMSRRRSDGLRDPMTVGMNCRFGVSSGVLGLSIGDNCSIGANIVLEIDSQIWDADAGHHIPAASLNGQSNWSVRREVGHSEPVLRRTWQ